MQSTKILHGTFSVLGTATRGDDRKIARVGECGRPSFLYQPKTWGASDAYRDLLSCEPGAAPKPASLTSRTIAGSATFITENGLAVI